MLYGYARVSSRDQNADLQLKALKSAECDQIFVEKASGKNIDRKEFKRLRKRLKKGGYVSRWEIRPARTQYKRFSHFISGTTSE